MNWINKTCLVFLFVTISSISGCRYSLNGINIPESVKTVSVAFIENRAPIVAPSLSPLITEKLRDRFISQTKLNLQESGGDFDITGYISNYSVSPVGANNDASATVNRLSITVNMKLVCPSAPNLEFEKAFTSFDDFDATKSLSEVESGLIETITDVLVVEIFNKTTLNW